MKMIRKGKKEKKKVLKLNNSVFGLKQSPRCWNKRITSFLSDNQFIPSLADPCVFLKYEENNDLTIIAIYVDDCFIIGKEGRIKRIKEMFNKEFKMKDNEELKGFLGIRVERDEKELRIDQEVYVENILKRFKMENSKPTDTPIIKEDKKIKNEEKDEIFEDVSTYQSAIGSLIYLATATRPDIAFAVNQAAQAMREPMQSDWVKVKRIMRYLQKTKKMKIVYKRNEKEEDEVIGFSDASYGEDRKDRKSTSGYLFIKAQAPIAWKSKKQPIVSLSSMEAEYIALTAATKEALWLRKLEKEIERKKENDEVKIRIYEDNQSAIKTANDEIHNERSKHIDIRYHFIRERIKRKEIEIKYLKTEDMIADILTKGLDKMKIQKLIKEMGLK